MRIHCATFAWMNWIAFGFLPTACAHASDVQPTAPATTQPSNTWSAERRFTLELGDESAQVRQALLWFQQEAPRIAFDLLKAHGVPEKYALDNLRSARWAHIQSGGTGQKVIVEMFVQLWAGDSPQHFVASEVADDLVRIFRERLEYQFAGAKREQIERLERQVAHIIAQADPIMQQLSAARDQLRKQTGRADASPQRIREELGRLEDARQQVRLDLESKEARVHALSESIAKLAGKVEQSAQSDPVAAELQKVVDAREAKTQRIKQGLASGVFTEADYQEAVAEVAQARARLLERRTEAAQAAGGDILGAWNRELLELGVDSAELQVKLKRLDERSATLAGVTTDLEKIDRLQSQRDDLDVQLSHLRSALHEAQRELAITRVPRIIMHDSVNRPAPPPPRPKMEEGLIDPGQLERSPATQPR